MVCILVKGWAQNHAVEYSSPNKESTFSEILISAVKSTFSPSDHQKKPQRTPLDKFSQDLFFPIYNP